MKRYFCNCVHFQGQVSDLQDMIQTGKEIKYKTFCLNVHPLDRIELELELGYKLDSREGLTIKKDYHVQYYTGKLCGEKVYWMKQSATEYIFK